nr:hypothetical protein [uncultured Roseateles sp.]
MSARSLKDIASDFPRSRHLGCVSGYQPKLVGRLVEGVFVTGWTDEELLQRFETCDDLVHQLTAYCSRKLKDQPAVAVPTLMQRVRSSVEAKGWDITEDELGWIMMHVEKAMGDRPSI